MLCQVAVVAVVAVAAVVVAVVGSGILQMLSTD